MILSALVWSLTISCFLQPRNVAKMILTLPGNKTNQTLDLFTFFPTSLNGSEKAHCHLDQNAPAWFLGDTKHTEHISPVLAALH